MPDIQNIINGYNINTNSYKKYSTSIVEWLKPVIDLSDFYVYPTNGITEGLNYFMSNPNISIERDQGDYEWVDVKINGNPAVKYISVPSSIDGNYRDIPTDIPIALDIAYIGSTKIQQIKMTDNIQYVFYSFSKPFGINGVRTGWYFTRKREDKLFNLNYRSCYYNYPARDISELIIQNFSLDTAYNYYKDRQKQLCDAFDLTASDCVWLATSKDPKYSSFRRKGEVARLCLSEYMQYESLPKLDS